MSMSQTRSGWRTLAEPTHAVSRFGRAVEFPAGTEIRRMPIDVGRLGEDTVAVRAGFPFECEATPRSHEAALWWVAASALRLEGERA